MQDRMIEGKILFDNPSNPRRDIYQCFFSLQLKRAFTELSRISSALYLLPIVNLETIREGESS